MKGFFRYIASARQPWILKHGSLSYLAWKKFKKNKLAFTSLLFIYITAFIAVLGYQVVPDSTPFANNQILQLATLKPGSNVDILRIRKNALIPDKGFFGKMIYGERNKYEEFPFSEYRIDGVYISVKEFNKNDPNEANTFKYHLADVLYTLDPEKDIEVNEGNILEIHLLNGKTKSINIKDLQSEVREKSIKSRTFWLGTDRFGRDLLSRLLIGTRVSLSVGLISVLISLLIGISLGAVSGFFRGWIDDLIIWLINVVWSIPTLLLVIAITFALGKGFWQVFIAVGLTMWVEVARVVRGQIISLREKEFIEAGRALGFSNFRIIYRHVLPNVMSPVIVISAANFAAAILIEAGLSFLGIGVQPPMPSWGSMIKEHYGYLILDSAYLAILPGLAIVLMVLAFMLIGNALRDALDVKTAS